jgi:cellulose synthase/poly-beta-1,6-N-acetylglucosamine synthase-like glycosyltransferase
MVGALAIVAVGYAAAACVIGAYACSQAVLWWRAVRAPVPSLPAPVEGARLPMVTVQLPLYNEPAVADRLIRQVAALDWPASRLEVQVLDDSTDETVEIVAAAVRRAREAGIEVLHVRRADRQGFKAGALAHGMSTARGEFIAIFDADFLPRPDFLRRAMSVFDDRVALVQARWGWLNAGASVLTRVQALHLDAHFAIEQQARGASGLFVGFNGTAGVWRRAAIEDAGGWSADTLTEDLDLSFRAQLAGWQVRYVDALDAPSELPEVFQAVRTQQHRWMKGGAQVARKLLPTIWAAPLPWLVRAQAAAQLLGSSLFGAVVGLCVVSPLLAPAHAANPSLVSLLFGPSMLVLNLSMVLFAVLYLTTALRRSERLGGALLRFVWDFPMFLTLSVGMCVHNALAAAEGWRGQQSAFVRTPKQGFGKTAAVAPRRPSRLPWVELSLGLYNLAGAAWSLGHGYLVGGAFVAMQGVGLCWVAALGLRR